MNIYFLIQLKNKFKKSNPRDIFFRLGIKIKDDDMKKQDCNEKISGNFIQCCNKFM